MNLLEQSQETIDLLGQLEDRQSIIHQGDVYVQSMNNRELEKNLKDEYEGRMHPREWQEMLRDGRNDKYDQPPIDDVDDDEEHYESFDSVCKVV